jgi:BirA family transcriptional regulator, biotin operon repressor / biotin---[acetyl-CoA-carboxylase] ligase
MNARELPAGYALSHLTETDSTNAEAMRAALKGERGPLWILADRQTAGRGRDGRAWTSLPGNLHASLLFSPSCSVQHAAGLALVAGVAAIDAIRAAKAGASPPALRLKWPNDILIGSAKVGGILIESTSQGSREALTVVIGVGINLATAPSDLAGAAASLSAHGIVLSAREALSLLAEAMDTWLKVWDEGAGFDRVRAAWLERAGPVGEPLTVRGGEGSIEGRFAGLSPDGALLITGADGHERRIRFGDVTLAGRTDDGQRDGKGR